MERYEPLTDELCEQIRADVAELVAPLAEKYGLSLDFVKEVCAASADSVAINLRYSLPERPDSVASLKEERDYKAYAEGFGLDATWFGKSFQRGNFTFTVRGLRLGAPKKCVVLERSDGSRTLEDGKLIRRYLG
ncbi:MAG: hypothetical protein C0621_02095 [Desulfuromonas sp.]|nr:MAG: hypothetical protein C0621_02095 [Desulfuromonas sp.]